MNPTRLPAYLTLQGTTWVVHAVRAPARVQLELEETGRPCYTEGNDFLLGICF